VLSKRNIEPEKGKWHFPGGTILLDEKLSNTINHIAKEETGLKLEVIKILDTIECAQIERSWAYN
jgi:ADP-ribose pyrophosphatase YjhB (NUDIX family)